MSRRCACGNAKANRAFACYLCKRPRVYDWQKRNELRRQRRAAVRDISAEQIDLLFAAAQARQRSTRAA